jgi:hypothetical protein
MIVEQRTYTFHPGGLPKFMQIYTPEVRAFQLKTLGNLIGYFTTEIGPLNQSVHLWGYDSFEDRMKRRAEMLGNDLWKDFVGKLMPLLVSQESKLLIPTAFSPIK